MTDIEISKALARAIGWKMVNENTVGHCIVRDMHSFWQEFDYRDWRVIGPIAEKYDCFPIKATYPEQGDWLTAIGEVIYVNTPQKAIALAVIKGAKK